MEYIGRLRKCFADADVIWQMTELGAVDQGEIMLNASIDKTWKNATLTLKAFDILNNHKNIVQTVGENYVSYQKVNTLPTYIMLTFTYKMNNTSSSSTPSNGIQRNNRFF